VGHALEEHRSLGELLLLFFAAPGFGLEKLEIRMALGEELHLVGVDDLMLLFSIEIALFLAFRGKDVALTCLVLVGCLDFHRVGVVNYRL
jgi:hypothetical protein